MSVLTSDFRCSSAISCCLPCVSACRSALSCYESVHLNRTRCFSWHAGGTWGPLSVCSHACCCPDCTLLSFISQRCFTFATILNTTEQMFFNDSMNRNNHTDCHISFILNMLYIHVLNGCLCEWHLTTSARGWRKSYILLWCGLKQLYGKKNRVKV